MKKTLFLFFVAVSLLAGCEFEKSADWYVANKNELLTKLGTCKESDKTINCINANKAAESVKLAVAEQFEIAKRCVYNLQIQLSQSGKVVDAGAACAKGPKYPEYEVKKNADEVLVNFTGDAKGLWASIRKRDIGSGDFGMYQWTCSTTIAYETFMPKFCVSKLVYR